MNTLPAHYRLLNPNEIIRKNDVFVTIHGAYDYVCGSIGLCPSDFRNLKFYRRRHVKVAKKVVKHNTPNSNNPLVSFSYPDKNTSWAFNEHHIRMVGANQKYIIGVDILPDNKFQFKRFLRNKVKNLVIVEFNPQSV